MEITKIEKRFETWKRILWMDIGAVFTLLATAVADLLSDPLNYFTGWFGVWFLVFMASFLPGFVLLFGSHYIHIPLQDRLGTISGFFIVTWCALLAAGIQIDALQSWYLFFLIAVAIGIAGGYWRLRQKSKKALDEIFP